MRVPASRPPDPSHLTPLGRISPSRYNQFNQCALREVWNANGISPILPVSPAARLGLVSHKILELAGQGCIDSQSMHVAWDDAVTQVEEQMRDAGEDHLIPLHKSAQRYEVKKRLTFAAVRRVIAGHQSGYTPATTNTRADGVEVWLESKDRLLGGFVDRIVPGKQGVELLDYKTGAVTERETGDVKVKYEIQLLLYAGLYHENRGKWPARLTLINLAGVKHDVPLDTARVRQLMDEARARLWETNELITSGASPGSLANPSPKACAFCGYRPGCKEYWKKRKLNPEWPVDVLGALIGVTILGNGTLFLTLRYGEGQVTVRGLSPERFGFLKEDVHSAMICDLRADETWVSFRQTNLTTAYTLESKDQGK